MLSANKRLLEQLQCLNTSQSPLNKQEADRILTKSLDKVQAERYSATDLESKYFQEDGMEEDIGAEQIPVLVKPGRKIRRRIASLCAACFAAGFFLFLLFLNTVNPTAAENLPIVGSIVEKVNRQFRYQPKEPEIPPEAEPSFLPSTPEPTGSASPSPQQAADTLFETISDDGRLTGEIDSLTGEGFTLHLALAFTPADGDLKQYRFLTYQSVELKLDGQDRRIRQASGLCLERQGDGDVWTGETEIDLLDYEEFEEVELQAELTFSGFEAWEDSPVSGAEGVAAGDTITFRLAFAPGAASLCSVENTGQESGEIFLDQLAVNSSKQLVCLEISDLISDPVVILCGEDGSYLDTVSCEKLGPSSAGSNSDWRGIAALPSENRERLILRVSGQDGVTLAEYTAVPAPSSRPSPTPPSPSPSPEGESSHDPAESSPVSNQPVPSVQPTVSPSAVPESRP